MAAPEPSRSVRWWLDTRCDYCIRHAVRTYEGKGWKRYAKACRKSTHQWFAQRDATGVLDRPEEGATDEQ